MTKINLKKIISGNYILASKSPRRIQLIKQIGLKFRSIGSDVKELSGAGISPVDLVRHNSKIKSRKVAAGFSKEIIIGADTIVVLGKKIIGKPENTKDAKKILKELSGRIHYVYTGINLINSGTGKEIFEYVKTTVKFRKLEDREINYYIKKYKPFDKAGAYGIQDDFGCLFIEKINGDYYNIVGLPLVRLYEMIGKIN